MRETSKALNLPQDVMDRFSRLYANGDFPHETQDQLRLPVYPRSSPSKRFSKYTTPSKVYRVIWASILAGWLFVKDNWRHCSMKMLPCRDARSSRDKDDCTIWGSSKWICWVWE
jgi:hypothetical protein